MRIFGSDRLELDARQARDEGGRGDRPPLGQQGAGEGAGQGRGAQLRHPQEPAEVRRRDERPAQGDLRPAPGDHGGAGPLRRRPRHAPPGGRRPASPSTCRPAPMPTSGTSTGWPRRCSRSSASTCRSPAWADEEGVDDEDIRERLTDGRRRADGGQGRPLRRRDHARDREAGAAADHRPANWREHLVTLDHLRSVVGFRGYAQRDPLNEYKSEAFQLFESLLNRLRTEVTRMLAHVQVMTQEEQQAMLAEMQARAAGRRPPRPPRPPRRRPACPRMAGAGRRRRRSPPASTPPTPAPGAPAAATTPAPAARARSTSTATAGCDGPRPVPGLKRPPAYPSAEPGRPPPARSAAPEGFPTTRSADTPPAACP